jgi:amidophosphoribosyltransferase
VLGKHMLELTPVSGSIAESISGPISAAASGAASGDPGPISVGYGAADALRRP